MNVPALVHKALINVSLLKMQMTLAGVDPVGLGRQQFGHLNTACLVCWVKSTCIFARNS